MELSITERQVIASDNLFESLSKIHTKAALIATIKVISNCEKNPDLKSALESRRKILYEMLDDLKDVYGIDILYVKGKPAEYYRDLILSYKNKFDYYSALNIMLHEMYYGMDYYATPVEYLERVVNNFSKEEDSNWKDLPLRIRLLRQFIKYGALSSSEFGGKNFYKSYAKKNGCKNTKDYGEVANLIDDGIYDDSYELASKEEKKHRGKYGLLKLCDDLSKGIYRHQGGTKNNLYYLAMFYGIKNIDDVEKYIFNDYYNNNLLRFMLEGYENTFGGYETDPSGIGINYKNYAEMIYLYYITKENLTPLEKINKAEEMIKNAEELSKDKPYEELKNKKTEYKSETLFYKNSILGDSWKYGQEKYSKKFELNEEEFLKFITEYYHCKRGDEGVIQVNNTQETAYKLYCKLEEEKEKLRKEDKTVYYKRRLIFTDKLLDDLFSESIWDEEWDKESDDEKSILDFEKILLATQKFFKKDEKIDSSKVTRTILISKIYNIFVGNMIKETESGELQDIRFSAIFNRFKNYCDPYLEECYYQTINWTNFFDILVVMSLYIEFSSQGEL